MVTTRQPLERLDTVYGDAASDYFDMEPSVDWVVSLLPVLIVAIWVWLNPRVFSCPKTTHHWASKAILGERVWLNRSNVPIPKHHVRAIRVLNGLSGSGGAVLLFGLIMLDMFAVIVGACVVLIGKVWFLDRMVWLFNEMIDQSPEYRQWVY